MAGSKENIVGFAVALQPTPGSFVTPVQADMIPISSPDNGSDPITADDPTLTGAIWQAVPIFLNRRGRAGATATIRGPGGAAPFAAGAWPLGRIFQAAGFSEVINTTAITGTAQAGGTTTAIKLAAGSSGVDDFYKGMPIQHPSIGTGAIRGASVIREYDATPLLATLSETVASAIVAGTYTIPPCVSYILSTALAVPLLSCTVWRHQRRYDYRDCALTSFAINIPVANDQGTDLPTVEFAMAGVPMQGSDNTTPALLQSALTPPPPAKAGKFTFAGLKLGHQTMRLEFGLTTGAPPNQNFDLGQEAYELLSGTRTVTADLNQQLIATLDIDNLTDTQTIVPMQSGWGSSAGNRFLLGIHNALVGAFSPGTRNGFVGVSGNANPTDIDKALSFSLLW